MKKAPSREAYDFRVDKRQRSFDAAVSAIFGHEIGFRGCRAGAASKKFPFLFLFSFFGPLFSSRARVRSARRKRHHASSQLSRPARPARHACSATIRGHRPPFPISPPARLNLNFFAPRPGKSSKHNQAAPFPISPPARLNLMF